jgi:hypothetical protein
MPGEFIGGMVLLGDDPPRPMPRIVYHPLGQIEQAVLWRVNEANQQAAAQLVAQGWPPDPKPYNAEQQEIAFSEAVASGCEIVRGDAHTLLLDFDSIRDLKHFRTSLELAKELFPTWGWTTEEWTSRSGNTHVRVSVPGAKSPTGGAYLHNLRTRIAFEVALGSDRNRGLLCLSKTFTKNCKPEDVSVLFKPGASPIPEGDSD